MKWYRGLSSRVRARMGAHLALQDHPASLLIIGKWAIIITPKRAENLDRDQFRRVVREATTVRVDPKMSTDRKETEA